MTEEDSRDFDDGVWATLETSLERAIEKGLPIEKVPEVASHAIRAALDESVPSIVETLVETMPMMLREHRRRRIHFERILHAYWTPSLNLLYAVVVSAEEAGREFFSKYRYEPGTNMVLLDALGGLHARACRTALEVHRLLTGGLPLGALSRCRTLHEIAVTASVIATYGALPEHKDLPSRFMLHHHISTYKDALQYQAASSVLGHKPLTAGEIQRLVERKKELVRRFGANYASDYGWAVPLLGRLPNFAELEKLAQASHLRPYYRWASHEIHSGSKGVYLNVTEWNGRSYLGTGPTVEGLADPGQIAMISLSQTTANFLLGTLETPSPKAMLSVKAIQLLMTRAIDALVSAEKAVAIRSARVGRRHQQFEARHRTVRRIRVVRVAVPRQAGGQRRSPVPLAVQNTPIDTATSGNFDI